MINLSVGLPTPQNRPSTVLSDLMPAGPGIGNYLTRCLGNYSTRRGLKVGNSLIVDTRVIHECSRMRPAVWCLNDRGRASGLDLCFGLGHSPVNT
jgi:hypothetical protein